MSRPDRRLRRLLALLVGVLALSGPAPALAQGAGGDAGAEVAARGAAAPARSADDIRSTKQALGAELTAARHALETAGAGGGAAPAGLARAVRTLEQIDVALDEQLNAVERAADLEAARSEAEARIVALGGGDAGEERPFTFALLERLRDELEAMSAAGGTAAAGLRGVARDDFEAAASEDEQRQRALRQAREALAVNRDADRVAALTAAVREAELAGRLSREQRALREIDLANATRGEELAALRRSYLEQKIALVAGTTRFTRDDLQTRLEELERREFELKPALEAARGELDWVNGRLAEARPALDRAPDDPALVEQVKAHRLASRAWREEVALLAKQIERVARSKETWNRRFLLSTGNPQRADLPVWAQETRSSIEQLERDERLRSKRRDELRNELATLASAIDARADATGAVGRWLDEQRRQTERLIDAYDEALDGVRAHRRLDEKLLAEVEATIGSVSVGERVSGFGAWLRTQWEREVTQFDGRSITVKKVVLGIGLFLIGIWISRIISRLVGRRLLRGIGVSEDMRLAARTLTFWVLAAMFTLLAMHLAHVPLTVFTLVGGALAIGVGFGAQNLINNFISGWILISERPVRIGDLVELDGAVGRVERVGARCTSIRRMDGIHLLVPNSLMLERTVVNWTHADRRVRTRLRVGVVYGSPTDEVEALIHRICTRCERVLPSPAPIVIFEDFGDNALLFDVYFWVEVQAEMDIRRAKSEIRFAIDHAFRAAGIVIAFPQRDVHLDASGPLEVRMVEGAAEPPDDAARRRERRATLARVELFESLNAGEIDAMAAGLTERAFDARTDIVRQGETGTCIYIVTRGLLEVTLRTGDDDRELAQLVPGDFFGEMSLLTGDPHSATVTAVTDASAYVVSKEMLEPILRNRPEVAAMLGRTMAARKAKHSRGAPTGADVRAGAGELRRRIQAIFGLGD